MTRVPPLSIIHFIVLLIRIIGSSSIPDDYLNRSTIVAIVDCGSVSGRQEKTAMEIAIEDFRTLTGRGPALHVRDSRRDPIRAASIAIAHVKEKQVQAIIGPRTWQELAFVAEVGERAQIPILSIIDSNPSSASERWPYLVRVSRDQRSQMRAIAAIVRSWHWRRVTIIYEDIDFIATNIIPHLADALQEAGSTIDYRLALPPSSTSLEEELNMLKGRQCRVFVVHSSMQLASRLFAEAKKMGMMGKSYVWITTDGITNFLDSINSSVISSMQGVIGVKNYFRPSPKLSEFNAKFQRRFYSKNPEEERKEAPYFALQAYDAVWAVAMAMERITPTGRFQDYTVTVESSNYMIPITVSEDGRSLLEAILQINTSGLTGELRFVEGELVPTRTSQIVNVVGKSYRELGFWSYDLGFSESVDKVEGCINTRSMKTLGPVFWPGGPWTVPKGLATPTDENPLKIAVPANAVFPDFVNVQYVDHNEPIVEGFSIDVFEETAKRLPYYLPYKFIPYNGTYDSLEEGHLKGYDMLVGDTCISSGHYQSVEFSQPYTPSGLVMVVQVEPGGGSKAWIFLKPFTPSLWGLTAVLSIYNGLVVWLIERRWNIEFRGSVWNQMGTLFWLSFTTLLSPGERLNSNLSRVPMVVWLFVALVLTSNYTASLSSLLAARRVEPNLVSVESLKSSNAMVGCNSGSAVEKHLEQVLGFHATRIKKFAKEDDYPRALRRGAIKAAFLSVPHANMLLAKYCTEFTTTGPVYNVGGMGFVFPKGSPILSDVSAALLQVFESGEIQRLETAMLSSYNCSSSPGPDDPDFDRLSLESFWGLFTLTFFVSTIALMLYGVFLHSKDLESEV